MSGTPDGLTGYEPAPALTADIQANATRTTIPGPQGNTVYIPPGQKLTGYIPQIPGYPQWGMPKETPNFSAAQFSTTQLILNSPLALSAYKQRMIAPVLGEDQNVVGGDFSSWEKE